MKQKDTEEFREDMKDWIQDDPQVKSYNILTKSKMSYRVNFFNPHEKIMNKEYNHRCNFNSRKPTYNNKIHIMNMNKTPNLMHFLEKDFAYICGYRKYVKTSDIITYLKSHNVKEIVLLDFSCSVFVEENKDDSNEEHVTLEDRKTRRIKRELSKARTNPSHFKKTKKHRANIESHYQNYG